MCQCTRVFKPSIRYRIKQYQKRQSKTKEFIIFYVNEEKELQVRIVKKGETPNEVSKKAGWKDWTNVFEYEGV